MDWALHSALMHIFGFSSEFECHEKPLLLLLDFNTFLVPYQYTVPLMGDPIWFT